jgi:hypothetical protein
MRVRRLARAMLPGVVAVTVAAGCGGTPWPAGGPMATAGPFVFDPANPTKPNTHWHAALGVYDCDHWLGDDTGSGIWQWPYATVEGRPARADDPNRYAGLHSHDDGVIHMEPATPDEAGRNATLGKYFDYGGWHISADGFDFLDTKVKNGDDCGGTPGTLTWKVARWDGTVGPQHYATERGDPAHYKLLNGDVVVVAFLPQGRNPASTGDPPSLPHLAAALGYAPAPTAPTAPPVHTAAVYSSG